MAGSRKKSRNLVLLLLVLVVAAGAYLVLTLMPEKKEEEDGTGTGQETTQGTELVGMESADVVKLEYKGQNSSMALVKEEDTWYREDDRDFPVNQSYVTGMVSLASGLSATKTVNEKPESLADYGLAEPAVWVRVTDSEGKAVEIGVGIKSPAGDGCYVSVDGGEVVYLASTAMLTQFQYTENQMIAKLSTPSITAENITKILIEKPEGNVELSLEPGNDMDTTGYNPWLLRQGFEKVLPGNSDTIGVLVDNYTSFPLGDCVEYECDDPAAYGLAAPAAVLNLVYYETVETGETDEETGEPVTEEKFYSFAMKVGNPDGSGNYYVQLDGSNAVYLMAQETVDGMIQVEPYDYVSRLPGLVNIAQVDRITVEYDGKTHVMSLSRASETKTDEEGNEEEEEVITYFLDDQEVEKSEFTTLYQQMIGVAIDGLVDEAVVAQNPAEPVLTLTYDRTGAGLAPAVTEFFSYDENFGRISVDGMSYFRVNIRDIETLIERFEEIFR